MSAVPFYSAGDAASPLHLRFIDHDRKYSVRVNQMRSEALGYLLLYVKSTPYYSITNNNEDKNEDFFDI